MNEYQISEELNQELVKWRRDLHQIPECGVDLPETAAYIKKVLDEIGVDYVDQVGLKDAIVATVVGEGEGNGKVIALRGDTDGLPVEEKSGLDFASTNGRMHACGHDAHAAMLLATVKAIHERRKEFGGTVKFLFQPGEEISGGAKPMVDAGALKDPKVDYVLGLHVGNIGGSEMPGQFLIAKGPMMACLDRFTITIKGKGAHGAYPHGSFDPIVMAGHVICALQEIRSRELDPVEPGVITLGRVQGGKTYNVIPEEVVLEGTLRAVNEEVRAFIVKRIDEICQGIAKSFRGEATLDYFEGAPPLINDSKVVDEILGYAKEEFGPEGMGLMERPVMGGEDFAYYLKEAPGAFIFLSNPMAIDGEVFAHHNPKFAIDDSLLHRGVQLFCKVTMELLKK